VIQEHIKKPLAEEILFGKLKDGGIVKVVVEEKDGDTALGFEYIKSDAPIRPRGPDDVDPDDDVDPEGSGPDGPGGAPTATKPKPKKSPRRPPAPRRSASKRGLGSSPVPKVPLGSR
jgi:ATP-dependent Clp protease ATP-binding subunit ClpA